MGKKLASGAHSTTYEGLLGDRRVAVKVASAADVHTANEIRAYAAVPARHDNLTLTMDPVPSPDKEHVYLPMERADEDLMMYTDARGGLEEWEAARVFTGVIRGLRHLHTHGVYHMDLKPENILLFAGVAKLADLGSAYVAGSCGDAFDDDAGSTRSSWTTKSFGTSIYAAPESLVHKASMKATSPTPSTSPAPVATPTLASRTRLRFNLKFLGSPKSRRPTTRSSITVVPEDLMVCPSPPPSPASPSHLASPIVASTSRGYDAAKADVWALGVSLFVLVTGYFPWKAATLSDRRYCAWAARHSNGAWGRSGTPAAFTAVFGSGKECTQHGTPLSYEFMDLMRGMLHPSPSKRLTLQSVADHAFFAPPRTVYVL